MRTAGKIRTAIVGVGSCGRAIMEGVAFYQERDDFLIHKLIGVYRARDIDPVLLFDVDAEKVGHTAADLVNSHSSCPGALRKMANTPILRGPTLDGIRGNLRGVIKESPQSPVDVASVLRKAGIEVVVNLVPTGAEKASRYYADAALQASCDFINCTPAHIARDQQIRERFEERRLSLIGDDVKSQFGSTWLHQILVDAARTRGLDISGTYQVNLGGNMDFFNLVDAERGEAKRASKSQSLQPLVGEASVSVGNICFAEFLNDRKDTYIRIDALGFAGNRVEIEARLRVEDSPNLGGVVFDAIRFCRIIKEGYLEGIPDVLAHIRSFYMKSPPMFHDLARSAEILRMASNGEFHGSVTGGNRR